MRLRSAFLVRSFEVLVFSAESFYYSDFRFSVSTSACGRDRHHDTSGRYTQNSGVSFAVVMHLFLKPLRLRARVSIGTFGAHTPCGPAAAHVCPPARCEDGALREGVPLRNTRFAEADLRGVWTGREVAHRLACPPRGLGVSAQPVTKQGAPQDPRQNLASGRMESGQKRNGTACGSCGPG